MELSWCTYLKKKLYTKPKNSSVIRNREPED